MQVQVQANDRMKLEVHGSVKIRRKVHSSATTGARQLQKEFRAAWQCQSTVKGYD